MDFANCSMKELLEFAWGYTWDELGGIRTRPEWMAGTNYCVRAREIIECQCCGPTFVIEREGPQGTQWITWSGDPWEP